MTCTAPAATRSTRRAHAARTTRVSCVHHRGQGGVTRPVGICDRPICSPTGSSGTGLSFTISSPISAGRAPGIAHPCAGYCYGSVCSRGAMRHGSAR